MRKKLTILLAASLMGTALYGQTYKDLYATSLKIKADANSANEITIVAPTLSSNLTFTLPSGEGTNGQILTTDGAGVLSWSNVSGGGIAGSDTEIQFNDSGVLGTNSDFIFDDTNKYLGINDDSPTANVSVGGNMRVGNTNGGSLVIVSDQGGTDYTFTLQAPDDMTTTKTFNLPPDYGTNGQLITTNGSFGLQWSTTVVSTGNDCIGIGNDGNDVGTNTVDGSLGFIGGGTSNEIGSSGANSFIGAGENNTVNAVSSAIGGGENNTITGEGYSFIGAGRNNTIKTIYAAIMAGEDNTIDTLSQYSFIGAGRNNEIKSTYSAIGAGQNNTIDTSSSHSFIGAGLNNSITGSLSGAIIAGTGNDILNADYSIIGAGLDNNIEADYSFIAAGNNNDINGGSSNFIGAGQNNTINGNYNSIPGGESNSITGNFSLVLGNNSDIDANYAVAFGRNADVNHSGSFVLNASSVTLASSTTNQMTAGTENGTFFYTNANQSNGARVQPGANAWSTVSDRNMKENIIPIDVASIGQRTAKLPIYSWSYKSSPDYRIRNYGPMAQDVFSLFGKDEYGTYATDTTVIPIHLTSLAVATLQANAKRIAVMRNEYNSIKAENDSLEEEIIELEKLVNAMESK